MPVEQIQLVRTGARSAVWLLPKKEGEFTETEVGQSQFAQLPAGPLKSVLTATYADISSFAVAFGTLGGTFEGTPFLAGVVPETAPSWAVTARFSLADGKPVLSVGSAGWGELQATRTAVTLFLGYSVTE